MNSPQSEHNPESPFGSPDLPEISRDRRRDHRYPVALAVKYEAFGRWHPLTAGHGRTIDLSSGGIRFTAESPLEAGLDCTLFVQWPASLQDGVQLQLVVWGKVVRTQGVETAIRLKHHDFRTRSYPIHKPPSDV